VNPVAKVVDTIIDVLLSREAQQRLGRHILNRSRGEGNGDPFTNGEYALLTAVKEGWRQSRVSPTLFDVGANIGEWSFAAAEGLGATARVCAFEPSPRTFELLDSRITGTRQAITAFNFALGDIAGTAPLYVDEESAVAGTNSLHRRHAEMHYGLRQFVGGQVEVRRGDNFCAEAGIERVHFLKIDTEGHEVAVLRGFKRLLELRSIDYIQFEYGSSWADARCLLRDAFEVVQPHGYGVAKLHPKGVEFFGRYDQREETYAFANYVAVRRELSDTLPRLLK